LGFVFIIHGSGPESESELSAAAAAAAADGACRGERERDDFFRCLP